MPPDIKPCCIAFTLSLEEGCEVVLLLFPPVSLFYNDGLQIGGRSLHFPGGRAAKNPTCTLCSLKVMGSYFHMFWECSPVAGFWNYLSEIFEIKLPCYSDPNKKKTAAGQAGLTAAKKPSTFALLSCIDADIPGRCARPSQGCMSGAITIILYVFFLLFYFYLCIYFFF